MGSQDVGVAVESRGQATTTGQVLRRRAARERLTAWPTAFRVAAHLLAWLPFITAGEHVVRQGWRPVSDAAAIALRSWDVLSTHGPMVGQATRLAQGVFDPGPLQYWLLTVPVHLDPRYGLLWGAALWCMVAASLMVEAAWSVARQAGALFASMLVVATVAWMPGVALQPYWNPWFGIMFLYAALAACWAVMSGNRGWWPVLAVTASLAAQSHLMFAGTSVALVVAAFAVGLADGIRGRAGYRWAAAGLIAGAACWVAPLMQQLEGRRGNLAALIHAQAIQGPREGLAFGLKALAGSTEPPATWWKPLQSLLNLNLIDRRSAAAGAVALIVLAALVAAGHLMKSRRLAALAGVSLLVGVGTAVSYASLAKQSIPAKPSSLDTLNYLLIPMLAVGVLWWLTVGYAVVLAMRRAPRPSRQPAASAQQDGGGKEPRGRTAGRAARAVSLFPPVAGLAGVTVLAVLASQAAVRDSGQFPGVADAQVARAVAIASARIERQLPRQSVALSVAAPGVHYRKRRLLLGLAWELVTKGYQPRVKGFGWELGPRYVERGRPVTDVQVVLRGSTVSIVISGSATAATSR